MRSIKTTLLLAVAVLAMTAVAAPALALASNWKKNGTEFSGGLEWSQEGFPLASGASPKLNGRIAVFSSEMGGVDCPVSGTGSLTADSGTGQVSGLSINASGCKLSGLLASLCGENAVSSAVAGEPWAISATESGGKKVVAVSSLSVTYKFAPACTEFSYVVTGSATATPDDAASIGNLTLSGNLQSYIHTGGEMIPMGSTALTSASVLGVEPAGKYGIINQGTVKVTGSIGWFSAEYGSMSCPVTGTIALEPGSTGKLVSLSKSAGACEGTYSYWCDAPTSVSSGATPWTLTDQGTSIGVSGVSITFDYPGSGCDETSGGSLTANVNNANAISSTTLAGTLGEGGFKRSWSGSLNWTLAGVYGL